MTNDHILLLTGRKCFARIEKHLEEAVTFLENMLELARATGLRHFSLALTISETEPRKQEWEEAVRAWSQAKSLDAHLFYRTLVRGGPATRFLLESWGIGFEDFHVDRIIYVDPVYHRSDLPEANRQTIKAGLVELIASRADAALGDYDVIPGPHLRLTQIQMKIQVEADIKKDVIDVFPDLANWSLFLQIGRVRSEFNMLTAPVFRSLQPFATSCEEDIGLLVLLAAWRYGFRVERIQLGDVPEFSEDGPARLAQKTRVRKQLEALRTSLARSR